MVLVPRFFGLSDAKRGVYILPATPALALGRGAIVIRPVAPA
jgi:hypothetical protein